MKTRMWAIVHPNGEAIGGTIQRTRREAIASMTQGYTWALTSEESAGEWNRLRKLGYRCVPVTVTVEEK